MDISEATASFLANVSELVLIGSLVIGFIAAAAIFVLGNIKESYLKRDIAQAELKLEQLRRRVEPRSINILEFAEQLKTAAKARVRILFPKDDAESHALSAQLFMGLLAARWPVEQPRPIQASDSNIHGEDAEKLFSRLPAYLAAGGLGGDATVTVLINRLGSSEVTKAGAALRTAILNNLGSVSSTDVGYVMEEDIRVVVGPKP